MARTDVTLRARLRPWDGVVLEGFSGRSSHSVDDTRPQYGREGGTRYQHGGRIAIDRSGIWARGAYRLFEGDPALDVRIDGSAGFERAGLGGVTGHYAQAHWAGTVTSSQGARGWAGPWSGVTLFGAWDSGTYGARTGPPLDAIPARDPAITFDPTVPPASPGPPSPGPGFLVTDRTTLRGGAALSLFGATLSGAGLRIDSDVHLPLGIEPDRGAPLVTGGARNGWEVWGSLPMPLTGLRLEGSLQQWSAPGANLPERIYRGAFRFRRTFMESGNLELWFSLGVRGHDPMIISVPVPAAEDPATALQTVPFFQHWYGRIQVRILTVRIFINWENFAVRRDLQTFPGRVLPAIRASYGIRWTMWN